MPRVKVVSDGLTPFGTKVLDADTGEDLGLRNIRSVHWFHRAGTIPRVELVLLANPGEVVGEYDTLAERARKYLAALGRADHPDAAVDPVGALGQAAVDLQQALNFSHERRASPTLLGPPVYDLPLGEGPTPEEVKEAFNGNRPPLEGDDH